MKINKIMITIGIILLLACVYDQYTHTFRIMNTIITNKEISPHYNFTDVLNMENIKTPKAISEWQIKNITYEYDYISVKKLDYWQIPLETIVLKTGDCEDFGILSGEMLRAIGIKSKLVGLTIKKNTMPHFICIFKNKGSEPYLVFDCGILKSTPYKTVKDIVIKEYKGYPVCITMERK